MTPNNLLPPPPPPPGILSKNKLKNFTVEGVV